MAYAAIRPMRWQGELAHCKALASNTMRLNVSLGPSRSRVMIAEAVPGQLCCEKLPEE